MVDRRRLRPGLAPWLLILLRAEVLQAKQKAGSTPVDYLLILNAIAAA